MRAGARLPLRLVPTDRHAPASAGAGRGRHVAAEGRSGRLWGRQGTSGGCDFSHRGVVSYVGRVNEKMHVVITNCRKLSKELQQASVVSSGEGDAQGRPFPTSGVYASLAGGKSKTYGERGNVFLAEGAARAKAQQQKGVRVLERRSEGIDETARTRP